MFAIKRKENVAEAVRRIARERVDRALLALEPGEDGHVQADRVVREMRRGLSLLSVIGPAMDVEALRRERTALRRVLRGCGSGSLSTKRIDTFCGVLRDVRMRAGYWHLGGEEFAVLRPGLMRVVGTARRRIRAAAEIPGDTTLVPGVRETLRTYGHALRLVERSWPAVLSAERARVSALVEALDTDATEDVDSLLTEALCWMSETPGRWCDRVGGYWSAWRPPEGSAGPQDGPP
ncbi:MAG: hypothetical protein AAF328_04940 [Planctomycetota bacterium]